ncbi:alcohol-forming fatty acyl-CoA reductase-like [Gossypium australe]|uniref:Alcohol-forming fatty acyl-CoA reductase-like n=1 Tax=Gossypium australe TaxID=47621 RepID=A0A5B6W630_9ROSI|nr:alcohol-forming fatty acyl-CoA reductase-like [Gossypium australe]
MILVIEGIEILQMLSPECSVNGARGCFSGKFDGASVWGVRLDSGYGLIGRAPNCTTKRVILRTEDDKEVEVICEHRDYLSNVISTFVAEKLVQKGCEAYLAYVSVSDSGHFSTKDIRTVRDFSDLSPGLSFYWVQLRCPSFPIDWRRRSLQSFRLNFKNFWTVVPSILVSP